MNLHGFALKVVMNQARSTDFDLIVRYFSLWSTYVRKKQPLAITKNAIIRTFSDRVVSSN